MPNGIEVTLVYEQKGKLTDIAWAENEIAYTNVNVSPETCAEIEELFRHPIVMMKRTKSGDRETDITELIKSVSVRAGENTLTVTAVTSADSTKYLNPEYVAQAIEEHFAISGENGSHVITRRRLMLADGVTDFI